MAWKEDQSMENDKQCIMGLDKHACVTILCSNCLVPDSGNGTNTGVQVLPHPSVTDIEGVAN